MSAYGGVSSERGVKHNAAAYCADLPRPRILGEGGKKLECYQCGMVSKAVLLVE